MGLIKDFAKQVKVKVTKTDNDGRVLLCGEPVQIDEEGKEFFIIPAHQASYIKGTTPYDVGDEFIPEEVSTGKKH